MIKASVYSRGAVIWVSSTSFQKSDIGWPHQPPIEKFKKIFWKKEFECTKCKATFNWTIPGTKMTNTGPFLWNRSSKIQFFTDIWYLFCWRLLRSGYVTFLKSGWWNSNGRTSGIHRCLHHNQKVVFRVSEVFKVSQSNMKHPVRLINRLLRIYSEKMNKKKRGANWCWSDVGFGSLFRILQRCWFLRRSK